MLRTIGTALLWLAAIYGAVALQSGLELSGPLPVLTAIVAAWALTSLSPFKSVVCAALAGLACDTAGHDRLGLHLACYAALSAVAVTVLSKSHRQRAATTVVVAFGIATGDHLVDRALAMLLGQQPCTWMQLSGAALETGMATAALVLLMTSAIWIVRRLLTPQRSTGPLRLANRWTMLTE